MLYRLTLEICADASLSSFTHSRDSAPFSFLAAASQSQALFTLFFRSVDTKPVWIKYCHS
jgi:hypothetical protein